MNLLNIRTEYSYRTAFGRIKNIIQKLKDMGCKSAGICDRNGTWGHVVWEKECKRAGIKPIFGVELAVVDDARLREKQNPNYMSFVAKNNNGLKEIYELVTTSTENFYYIPRIDFTDINKLSGDVFVFIGAYPHWDKIDESDRLSEYELNLCPTTPQQTIDEAPTRGIRGVLFNDNFYCSADDMPAYQIAIGRNASNRTIPMHLMSIEEMSSYVSHPQLEIERLQNISEKCNVSLPKAQMVEFECDESLLSLCEKRAETKNVDLSDPIYKQRLDRELDLIKEKNFEDYFFVIWDMLNFARTKMLVGPGRGSSCGSLVCYLLDITEIDPIPHGLIFERFIDINRNDMPDIDIDFPDVKRDIVFKYVKDKYGEENVARLGSVNKFKAKSAISIAAKLMNIPPWEIKDLKDSLLDRPDGSHRSDCCIEDTFNDLEIGQEMAKKFPELRIAEHLEDHASHSGQHAAGIVVTAHPVSNYCSVDTQTGCAQIDKHDAETLDLLKIDALGLRTLTIIEDCLQQIGWSHDKLIRYPIDDKDAFNVINIKKYAGIFQFDGGALKSVCSQMPVDDFNDVAAITSLARPGPLASGGTQSYIDRKTGDEPIYYAHPLMESILGETYGVFVYQEQVMMVVREIGGLSWSETSLIRKAISKSMGHEKMMGHKQNFVDGAKSSHNIEEKISSKIFDDICTFGSYGFNKSHAVAYGLVSYWCMVLKAHFPLEWAVASLRHAGTGDAGEDRGIKLLRELDAEGIPYKPYDAEKSLQDWSYSDGVVIGGFTNIKGIGKKVADDIVRRRKNGEDLTPRQVKLLANGKTPFDMLYEGKELFGHILEDPRSHNIVSDIYMLDRLEEDMEGEYCVLAKMLSKTIRDENEPQNIEKRLLRAEAKNEDIGDGVMTGQTMYLNIKIEDDSGKMFYARVSSGDYMKMGKPIVDKHSDGDWFLWRGKKIKGISMLFLSRFRFMGSRKLGCVV